MSSIFTLRGVFLFWPPIILIVGAYALWDLISPIFDNSISAAEEVVGGIDFVAHLGMTTQHYPWLTTFLSALSIIALFFKRAKWVAKLKLVDRSKLALAISTAVCSAASIFVLSAVNSWATSAQVISLSIAILYTFAYLNHWQVMFFGRLKLLGTLIYLLLLVASGTTSVVGMLITDIHQSQLEQQQEWLTEYEPAMVKAEAAKWEALIQQFEGGMQEAQREALKGFYSGSEGCGPVTRSLLERLTEALPILEPQQNILFNQIEIMKGACTKLSFLNLKFIWGGEENITEKDDLRHVRKYAKEHSSEPIKDQAVLVLAEKWRELREQLLMAENFRQSYRQAQVDNPELRLRDLPIASLTSALKKVLAGLNLVGWLSVIASLLPEITLAGGVARQFFPRFFKWFFLFDSKQFGASTETTRPKLQRAVILNAIAVGVMIYNANGLFNASIIITVLLGAYIARRFISDFLVFAVYALLILVGLYAGIKGEIPQKAALMGGVHVQYEEDQLERNVQLILRELVVAKQEEAERSLTDPINDQNDTLVQIRSREWIRAMTKLIKGGEKSWTQLEMSSTPKFTEEAAAFQKLANLFDPTQHKLWETTEETTLKNYPILEVDSREFLAERGKVWKPIKVDLALVLSEEPARTFLPIMACFLLAMLLIAQGQAEYYCYCSKANRFV